MKQIIAQNSDVLGLNSINFLYHSQRLNNMIVLLCISILYTAQRFIDYKNGKKDSK